MHRRFGLCFDVSASQLCRISFEVWSNSNGRIAMKIRNYILPSIAALLVSIGFAAAAIPGPQRALAPGFYGLHEIAQNVFTDDISRSAEWLSMRDAANLKALTFFGELKSHPRYILCSSMECEHAFGKRGNTAVTYGWSYIHVPPKAINEQDVGLILLTHERVHAELVYRWGVSALWDKKIPSWFNEGLASFVSEDKRLEPSYSAEQRKWIRGSETFWDWGSFVDARGWRDAYGAAEDNVAVIKRKIGRDGLLALIKRTLAGEDFDKVEAQLMGL
jgi:hypothetical protein